jgi:hypothetical protein
MTQCTAEVTATHAHVDPAQFVAPPVCPGMSGSGVRRNRQRAGYLAARRMPATWRGFAGGVWVLPIFATRKHTWGPSTWSPPV